MQSADTFWDKISPKYAKSTISNLAAYEYTLERSISYLSQTDQVLELGCGTGMTALRLAPSVDHIVATDISAGMLEQCRIRAAESNLSNITFTQSDVLNPTLQTGAFDAVFAHSLLHLLPDLPQALTAINAMMEPGGTFISKTVCLGESRGLKAVAIRIAIPIMQFFGKAPFVASLTIAELEAAVVLAGFKIIESGSNAESNPGSRYLVARKI